MELTFPIIIFQTFPESLALASLAIVLAGSKLGVKNVLLIGLPETIAVYLVQLLDLSFGIHTIVLVIILAILLHTVLKIKLSWGLLMALFAMIILVIAETVILALTLSITGIEFEQVTRDPTLWILYGWPHIIFVFLLALLINRWRKKQQTHARKGDNNA